MSVSETAKNLRRRLEEQERIHIEDVKAWLAEEDVPASEANLVIGYGQQKNRRWWHRQNEELVFGSSKAALSSLQEDLPDTDPLTMETPEQSFELILRRLGVHEKNASAATFYAFNNYDMMDPTKAWEAISQSGVQNSLKRKAFQTWVNHISAEPPFGLMAEINKVHPLPFANGHSSGISGISSPLRYIAVDGRVVRTDPADESGVPYYVAEQNAKQQRDEKKPAAGDGNLAAAFATLGTVISAALTPKPPDNSSSQMMEWIKLMQEEARAARDSQREETRAMLDAQREQTKLTLELLTERQNNQMGKIVEALEGLNQNPFAAIREMLPNGDQVLARIFAPPASQGPVIRLGEGEVSIDTYRQIKEEERRDGMFALAREALPKFLQLGQDIAVASNRLATQQPTAQAHEEEEEIQLPPGYRTMSCVGCENTLAYNPQEAAFSCPGCGTRQAPPRILKEPVREEQVGGIEEVSEIDEPEEIVEGEEDQEDQEDQEPPELDPYAMLVPETPYQPFPEAATLEAHP